MEIWIQSMEVPNCVDSWLKGKKLCINLRYIYSECEKFWVGFENYKVNHKCMQLGKERNEELDVGFQRLWAQRSHKAQNVGMTKEFETTCFGTLKTKNLFALEYLERLSSNKIMKRPLLSWSHSWIPNKIFITQWNSWLHNDTLDHPLQLLTRQTLLFSKLFENRLGSRFFVDLVYLVYLIKLHSKSQESSQLNQHCRSYELSKVKKILWKP